MKRIILFCVFLALIISIAAAEPVSVPEQGYKFIACGDYGFPIEVLLKKIGYVDIVRNEKSEPVFDEYACSFLMEYQHTNGLEVSGEFDTLTTAFILGVDHTDTDQELVWIAMHGGTKYHTMFDCWNLREPRSVTIECAEAMDYTYCKICLKRYWETPPLQ